MSSLLIRNFTKSKIKTDVLEGIVEKFLKTEKIKKNVEISLVFVGEKRIRDINRAYRGVDRITDVISFEGDYKSNCSSGVLYLGEVFICSSRAKKQAKNNKHSLEKEIIILFVHGLFHLLGYDHISDDDYIIMNKKEKKLLNSILN